jgi:L-fucose mutarotase
VRVDARFRASVPVTLLDELSAVRALNAALSVMPLSNVVAEVVWPMAVVGDADQERPPFAEFQPFIARRARPRTPLAVLERSAFYKSTRKAFAVVATGGRRLYQSVVTRKGVIGLDEVLR